MSAWRVSRGPASRVSENHHWEFQALCLVYGHDPHALDAFFDNRGLIGLSLLGVSLEFLDEGPEGGSAALKMPRHVDQPLTIRERLLAIRPERDPGVRAQCLEQRGDCLGDRPMITPEVKEFQDFERVSDLDR